MVSKCRFLHALIESDDVFLMGERFDASEGSSELNFTFLPAFFAFNDDFVVLNFESLIIHGMQCVVIKRNAQHQYFYKRKRQYEVGP